MTDTLLDIHRIGGYVVLVVLVAAALWARSQGRAARPFSATPFAVAVGLVDLQVVLGIVGYGLAEVWDRTDDALLVYVHPGIAVAALVAVHVGVRRARAHQMVTDAYRAAASGMSTAAFLVAVAALTAAVS